MFEEMSVLYQQEKFITVFNKFTNCITPPLKTFPFLANVVMCFSVSIPEI